MAVSLLVLGDESVRRFLRWGRKYSYSWDPSGYWAKYQDYGSLLEEDGFRAIRTLTTSIRYDDYNLLPIVPLMPFHFVLGDGRLPYVLAIANLYVLPTIVLFFFLFKTAFGSSYGNGSSAAGAQAPENGSVFLAPPSRRGRGRVGAGTPFRINPSFFPYVAALTLGLLPQFWAPVLSGLPDVMGVLIITLIAFLYFRRPLEEQTLANLLSMSFLLVLITLTRRWYAFWVVSFFMTVFVDVFIFKWPAYRFEIKKYMPGLRNILVMGILSLLLLFLLATPVAEKMLLTNYSDAHSAWRRYDSSFAPLKNLNYHFGLLTIGFFFFGVIASILNQKTRRFCSLLFIQLLFIFLLFSRIQYFDIQHLYLLVPTIAIFMSLAASKILDSRPVHYQPLFLAPVVFLYFVNFSCAFVPAAHAGFERVTSSFLGRSHFPLK